MYAFFMYRFTGKRINLRVTSELTFPADSSAEVVAQLKWILESVDYMDLADALPR